MSTKFPNSKFTGVDISSQSIQHANSNIGNANNLKFAQGDAHILEYHKYDIVMAFDTIHDLKSPKKILEDISQALSREGIFLMLEFNMSSYVENNISKPFSIIYYAFSLMHCIPVSFASGGEGLGSTWGHEETEIMLYDAGFSTVKRLDTPRIQNCLYLCKVS